MGYVAVKGGTKAIEESIKRLKYERVKKGTAIELHKIEAGMRGLIDQVMSESSLYDQSLAALAIKQAEGNPEEAVFLLRAYRSIIKGSVALIRAVPTVLWVLIFAVAAGLGSVAAVIGMTFHSISYLVKAYSESFEEIDKGAIEALQASGANWWQIVFQVIIPSSITYIISWTFMRFEINFAVAVAMGAAAGAGGIGFDMFMASGFYFDLSEIGAITYFILIIAICLEIFATQIKRKLQVSS
ncbi:carbon-phosphorus lyase complex subunit PhnI [Peribacillus sp. NPDC096622]|uniref:carbon-phosphorus lyase complex subunit PhnI n=1 Tax=Peribacillus sp. NPDC096622 TaxID=3364396 RepID=UPI0037F3E3CE